MTGFFVRLWYEIVLCHTNVGGFVLQRGWQRAGVGDKSYSGEEIIGDIHHNYPTSV